MAYESKDWARLDALEVLNILLYSAILNEAGFLTKAQALGNAMITTLWNRFISCIFSILTLRSRASIRPVAAGARRE